MRRITGEDLKKSAKLIGVAAAPGLVAGGMVSIIAGSVLLVGRGEAAPIDSQQAQIYNGELTYQMHEQGQQPRNLIVEDSEHFQFTGMNALHETVRCSGEYEVKNAIAQVSGALTCSQMITLTK